MITKICSKCKLPKPLEEFSKRKNGKYGRDHHCKECASKRHKIKYANDVQYKERILKNNRKRLYKLSDNELDNLLNKNICDICGNTFISSKDKHIDHNHNNNKIRGILCQKCNLFLGNYELNLHLIDKINSYLKRI